MIKTACNWASDLRRTSLSSSSPHVRSQVINRINQDVDRQDVYKKWYLARHILPLDD